MTDFNKSPSNSKNDGFKSKYSSSFHKKNNILSLIIL